MPKVLIADDEATNRDLAQVICQATGHDCHVVTDGQEAWERLVAEAFDLLILDVLMPRLDGIALTRRLRADPRWAGLPIIGLTARANGHDLAEMLAAGMNHVVTKPYRRRDLVEAIARFLPPAV